MQTEAATEELREEWLAIEVRCALPPGGHEEGFFDELQHIGGFYLEVPGGLVVCVDAGLRAGRRKELALASLVGHGASPEVVAEGRGYAARSPSGMLRALRIEVGGRVIEERAGRIGWIHARRIGRILWSMAMGAMTTLRI